MNVFEQFFCPAGDDFLVARMTDCGFGICGCENPPASCVRLGTAKCQHVGFSIQVNDMFQLPMVEQGCRERGRKVTQTSKKRSTTRVVRSRRQRQSLCPRLSLYPIPEGTLHSGCVSRRITIHRQSSPAMPRRIYWLEISVLIFVSHICSFEGVQSRCGKLQMLRKKDPIREVPPKRKRRIERSPEWKWVAEQSQDWIWGIWASDGSRLLNNSQNRRWKN